MTVTNGNLSPEKATTEYSTDSAGPNRAKVDKVQDSKSWAAEALTSYLFALRRGGEPVRLDLQSRNSFLDRYARRLKEGTAIKWLKFHTSYAFAYGLNQDELPVAPGPLEEEERAGIPVGGDVGKVVRRVLARARTGNWAARRTCYDILMSKLGMPVVPESFVEQTFRDHQKVLTEPREVSMLPDKAHVHAVVKEKIDEICRTLFHGERFGPSVGGPTLREQDLIPSMRASFSTTLGDGGAFGSLIRKHLHADYFPRADELLGMVETAPGRVREVRWLDFSYLVESFQRSVDRTWMERLTDRLDATPCAILEPLKVRVITKGQDEEYYRALELQKHMHGVMRRHPVFKYIGQPATNEDFLEAFGTKDDLLEDQFYVSGDYKAATDNLDPSLSAYAWERICWYTQYFRPPTSLAEAEAGPDCVHYRPFTVRLTDTPYYQLGLKCLTQHRLHYKFGTFDQCWGQLMGSPVSFPILCLVNAAATLASQGWKFSRVLPLRINGDDVGFITNSSGYSSWKAVTRDCGLEFSVGKNYTSRDFLIMNSELRRPPKKGCLVCRRSSLGMVGFPEDYEERLTFHALSLGTGRVWDYDVLVPHEADYHEELLEEKVQDPWHLEGFLNQALLTRKIKKGTEAGNRQDVYWWDLSSRAEEVVRGLKPETRDSVLSMFYRRHRDVISEMPRSANLFFAKSLGGAGCPMPANYEFDQDLEIYDEQLQLAAVLACTPKHRMSRPAFSRPLKGTLGTVIRDVRRASDSLIPSVIRPRPRIRNQGTHLIGGGLFLGSILRSFVADDSLLKGKLGGEEGSVYSEPVHKRTVQRGNKEYRAWASRHHTEKLSPMDPERAMVFEENLVYFSYIEVAEQRCSVRVL
jgi:hypothetical protein